MKFNERIFCDIESYNADEFLNSGEDDYDFDKNYDIFRQLQINESELSLDDLCGMSDDEIDEAIKDVDIIKVKRIDLDSMLAEGLLEWFGLDCYSALEDKVRSGYIDRDNWYLYYVTGFGYDTISSDLLGGDADGKATKEFIGFLNRDRVSKKELDFLNEIKNGNEERISLDFTLDDFARDQLIEHLQEDWVEVEKPISALDLFYEDWQNNTCFGGLENPENAKEFIKCFWEDFWYDTVDNENKPLDYETQRVLSDVGNILSNPTGCVVDMVAYTANRIFNDADGDFKNIDETIKKVVESYDEPKKHEKFTKIKPLSPSESMAKAKKQAGELNKRLDTPDRRGRKSIK